MGESLVPMLDSNGRIRLVVISGQLGLGGAEQQLYHLLSHLDQRRFRASVVTLGAAAEYWEGPIASLGVPVIRVPRGLGRVARAVAIARVLRAQQTDIVHSWVLHANPYAAVAGRLASTPVRLGSVRGSPRNSLWYHIASRGLDLVVTNSTTAAGFRRFGHSRPCFMMVPNGVPIPPFTSDEERNKLRAVLGLRPTSLAIGAIGRMDANKNYEMLLNGTAILAKTRPDIQVALVGDGPSRSDLLGLTRRLGMDCHVVFPGVVPHASQYLSAFDVVCVTSYSEGMSNVVMEAGAAAVPVISTAWSGCEALLEDGKTGLLVPLNDPERLSTALQHLLDRPDVRARIGRAARDKMRQSFSIETMVDSFARLYQNAARR